MTEVFWGESTIKHQDARVDGGIVEISGEKYYRVRNYDRMPAFLMSLVSSSDHWMYVSSSGGLTCGRGNRDRALFPYETDDKIHDSAATTGPKTCFLVERSGKTHLWLPFYNGASVYSIERRLYKSIYGSRLIFEEVNHDLGMVFSYAWSPSERFGFVRSGRIRNTGSQRVTVRMLDGMRNILAPGINQEMQNRLSTLVDAYKVSEVDETSGAGVFSLSALPTDRAEPLEALQATLVFCVGLERSGILLSEKQVGSFCSGDAIQPESRLNGQRGAYFVQSDLSLGPAEENSWHLVAEIGLGATELTRRLMELPAAEIRSEIEADIRTGEQRLRELVAAADGVQLSSDDRVCGRHFANTLFNIMRGGTFIDDYRIPRDDLLDFVSRWNAPLTERFAELLQAIEGPVSRGVLIASAEATGDPHLRRLALEYLPLIFSRRHGDPSRPWNKFNIDVRDSDGNEKLGYEGNWRDIFQNWEALGQAYPEFAESFVARFVNASTADGYNPYRVSRDGFDWEVLDPDDDWSNIGYWGDHQVVYLLRLLQLSTRFNPGRLSQMLDQELFVYADVPYRIKPYERLLENPRDSIVYDSKRARDVAARCDVLGADGRLRVDADGAIHTVSLLEKLLVTVLCKLTNFVPGGGIWMNTQRPEWNDANNALAGYGLSMVTVYYLYRLVAVVRDLTVHSAAESFAVSEELEQLAGAVSTVLAESGADMDSTRSVAGRKQFMDRLGQLGSDYREFVYRGRSGKRVSLERQEILDLLDSASKHLEFTIQANRRPDGLFNSYNLVEFGESGVGIKHLQVMLEGQVAVLGSGLLDSRESLELLDALRASDLYRPDQRSYTLYPDKKPVGFLARNVIPDSVVRASPAIQRELDSGCHSLVERDPQGNVRFNSAFSSAHELRSAMDRVSGLDEESKRALVKIYDDVFRHREFTGRSGTMYKYEGLGSVYWHMVSKLLLAVCEAIEDARAAGAEQEILSALEGHFDSIRDGLGVHKSPAEYGAIPLDPYSHTPAFIGVQQPGMTGQVKEDILSRFSEIGVRVCDGRVRFDPHLLREDEFLSEASAVTASTGKQIEAGSLMFGFCGTPVIYKLSEKRFINIEFRDHSKKMVESAELDASWSRSLFGRDGRISRLVVGIPPETLR